MLRGEIISTWTSLKKKIIIFLKRSKYSDLEKKVMENYFEYKKQESDSSSSSDSSSVSSVESYPSFDEDGKEIKKK